MYRAMIAIGALVLAACGGSVIAEGDAGPGGSASGGSGSGTGLDPCQAAYQHLTECTGAGAGSSTMPPCTGALLCQSTCINAHTCAEIVGNDPNFVQCVVGCQGK